jgi:hypothetical protein
MTTVLRFAAARYAETRDAAILRRAWLLAAESERQSGRDEISDGYDNGRCSCTA